jgi:electron transport complex protein RnfC
MDNPVHKLWKFPGGLPLEGHKSLSTGQSVIDSSLPSRLILPLQQHIGEPAEPVVKVGEKVLKGQLIARANGYVSVPVHASTSGMVSALTDLPVAHPSGLSAPCIVIEPDGEERWTERHPVPDYLDLDRGKLRNLIREAGIVGLGGAGFPTFIKLNPGPHRPIETLVLNGAECEPYITCDDMLMRERAEEVIAGVQIMQYMLGAQRCIVGIEDNKPEAYAAIRAAIEDPAIEVVQVPTRYPAGGEKQLIRVLTGQEVPSQGLPAAIGVVCQNVATAAAVYRAIVLGEPLVSRIVTVTGQAIRRPGNLQVPIGMPIDELLAEAGGTLENLDRLIMGGPMMGFALPTDAAPVVKTTNCILAATQAEVAPSPQAQPCIRCGACVEACPARLLPQQLYWHTRAKEFDKVQDYHLFDCIECGCCAYVCPSHIPLVQYYRYAKTEIWAQERDRQRADLARQRHEHRLERLQREKRERAERHRKKKAALAASTADEAQKKATIQAAVARAKAKREAAATQSTSVDTTLEDHPLPAKPDPQRVQPPTRARSAAKGKGV